MSVSLRVLTAAGMAGASGALLAASFVPSAVPWLAWCGLVPLLVVLRGAGSLRAFCLGFLAGAVFVGLSLRWLLVVAQMPGAAFAVLVCYGAAFTGLFALSYSLVSRRTRLPLLVAAPLLWVAIEYLRGNLGFLAAPFCLLGFSQHAALPFVQLASLTSVYGLSFILVLVNVALAEAYLWAADTYRHGMRGTAGRIWLVAMAAALAGSVVLAAWGWGRSQIEAVARADGALLKVALVQGNIPQDEKWDVRLRRRIQGRYEALTLDAALQGPDLIAWPESATTGYFNTDREIAGFVTGLARRTKIPILLGSATHEKIVRGERREQRMLNSAFLVNGEGRVLSSYDKIRLLPFAEYLPLPQIPWPRWLVPRAGRFAPGMKRVIFELPRGRFGVVICWEVFFPDLFRRFVGDGAQFMINLTNEAWFSGSAASEQLLAMSIFRAVENRVSLLRVANTGITGIIDPAGRVRARLADGSGNTLIAGTLVVSVPRAAAPSFYTRYGDLFALTCALAASIAVALALVSRRGSAPARNTVWP
ncbi:MAG: apolipoprotein N-acyltransferase [Candidatus Muproteobacteria bacterium RIFCSPLOWO2_01_FULL_60_18]|uniref:Apolipoprotein N-acyltransferase n=1 Tax=Candidatus Muproteobacteria bacterium RIFCSPLOWO2_01_FULL_60_18 TaxID=1817768 RepID=A0A1F6U1E9_9PROT|nr:MAG: apolipoprotein N-acyltransferase [Candidatus Muproteobacteria bacterium RIFCSPLOWO2_01_FULL_60_18]